MATLKLRDRDAIITKEGIIFRVYGYFHPPDAYVCDAEYAPTAIYRSMNPMALRGKKEPVYYKFYADEGLQFVREKYPRYMITYEPLKELFVGVRWPDITETRTPNDEFRRLIKKEPSDALLKALHRLSNLVTSSSGLSANDFGVFGSILHGFYHPEFSDLDLIVYGREKLKRACESLKEMYQEKGSLRNEFESEKAIAGKRWNFVNYGPKEYLWHQRRKMIYALFDDKESGRVIKTEFEPVKDWNEICNEYGLHKQIVKKGWIKAITRIVNDYDAPFIPSIYQIEPITFLGGPKAEDPKRILSYVEEFRMQAKRDEEVYVEGNLEQVVTATDSFHQITLTYGPRYYEQALKVLKL